MRYDRVVEWSTVDGMIRLELLGEDHKTHRIEVNPECAGALAAALGAEIAKLGLDGKDQQLIRPKSMQTGKTYDGEPMIILTLQGGMELPLVFRPAGLDLLAAEIDKLRGEAPQGSEIRWT